MKNSFPLGEGWDRGQETDITTWKSLNNITII
jgi:hypothetical protein